MYMIRHFFFFNISNTECDNFLSSKILMRFLVKMSSKLLIAGAAKYPSKLKFRHLISYALTGSMHPFD